MDPRPKLDRIDINILAELQRNGRIAYSELAELVHLSTSACLARVKKLQASGYISCYAAQINMAKLGETMTVFTEVTLKNHTQPNFARFQDAIHRIETCTECHLVSGRYDYLLKFVTSGILNYQSTMERLIDRDIGIDKYFSYVVIKSPFVKTQMPLVRLFGEGP